jgi:hypothetical protein
MSWYVFCYTSEKYPRQNDVLSIDLAEHFVREEQREKEKRWPNFAEF